MKILKRITIVAASLFVLYLVAALLVSPISKWYIEKHAKDMVGRTVKMEDLGINIFTGKVYLENLVMYESDDTTSFFSVRNFETNLDLTSLLSEKVVLDYIHFTGINLQVTQQGNSFNFDDIIAHFSKTDTLPPDTEKSAWGVILNDIQIQRSNVFYRDLVVGSDWGSRDFSLVIPGIDLSDMQADMGLRLNLTNGGVLSLQMNYVPEMQTYTLDIAMDKFGLSGILPYVQRVLNVDYLTGWVDVNLRIEGHTQHVMDIRVGGKADVCRFAMGVSDNQIVGCDSLHLKIRELDLENRVMAFDTLALFGAQGRVDVFTDSTSNLSRMLVASKNQHDSVADTAQKDETPLLLSVGTVCVKNASFTYSDGTLPQKFVYHLTEINADAQNFNPDSVNHIRAKAILQKTGMLSANWNGSLHGVENHNIMINLKNLNLTDFSPYSLSYFGYPISSGTLAFSSQNIIENHKLTGINKLDIVNPELEEKEKSVEAEYNLPLKMGLYLLTDRDHKISLDLPVSGDVDSPTFSYKKLIIKTLENILLKVVASPFSVMTDLVVGEETLQYVPLDACQMDFTLEQYAQFDKLVDLLQAKPELQITLEQQLNYNEGLSKMAELLLKRSYYLYLHPEKKDTMPDLFDREAFAKITLKDSGLLVFVDSQLHEKQLAIDGDVNAKAMALYADEAAQMLQRMMDKRNERLKKYLLEQKGMSASALRVTSMPIDLMKQNNGKSMYAVECTMAEPTPAPEDNTEEE